MGIQRLNKKGVSLSSSLLSIVGISILVIAVGVALAGWDTAYSSDISSDLEEFNKLNELSDYTKTTKSDLGSSTPQPEENTETSTFRSSFGVIANIFSAFDIVLGENGMIDNVTDKYGIPNYIRQGIITIIAIVLIFSFIAVIFRQIGRTRV